MRVSCQLTVIVKIIGSVKHCDDEIGLQFGAVGLQEGKLLIRALTRRAGVQNLNIQARILFGE